MNSIPDTEHSWFEYQAYAFAGLVLVPRFALLEETHRCVNLVRGDQIDLHENWDFAWSRIAAFLAKQFQVSTQVIEKRLAKDSIPELFAG